MEWSHIYNIDLCGYLRRTMFTGISVRNIYIYPERKTLSVYIWNMECWLGYALLGLHTCKCFMKKHKNLRSGSIGERNWVGIKGICGIGQFLFFSELLESYNHAPWPALQCPLHLIHRHFPDFSLLLNTVFYTKSCSFIHLSTFRPIQCSLCIIVNIFLWIYCMFECQALGRTWAY